MLRLPLSAVVLAILLVSDSGPGAGPLIIVGVVVAYLTTIALGKSFDPASDEHPQTPAATGSGSSAERVRTTAVRAA